MDISSAKWVSEMEIEDPTFFHQYPMDIPDCSLEDLDFLSFPLFQENPNINDLKIKQNPQNSHISETCLSFVSERPAKQMRKNKPSSISSSSQIISFEHSNSSPTAESMDFSGVDMGKYGTSPEFGRETKIKGSSGTRTPLIAKEHVLAERKRREKINERFIALSALLPGLKKADKATVLGDAIKHLNQLQEKVRKLEEEQESMRSVVFVKKSHIFIDEEISSSSLSSDENFNGHLSDHPLPEIEARVSKNDVLIKIHSEKGKGCMVNVLSEIEKLRLSVVNSIVLPFGNSTLDITVLAKMDEEFSMPVKDLVKNLRLAILQFP